MVILEWNGEIGWDLWQGRVKTDLKMSSGEDVTVRFSSIGGDIFEGADIISLLTDHKRDNPGIKMLLELKGVAASMGSAISASPVWDDVAVESITAYMIHRPTMFSYGDFEDMESRADFLKKANDVFAQYYADRSGIKVDKIQELMKAETWYYGQAIVDAGFADRVIQSEESGDEKMIMTTMKQKFATMCASKKERDEKVAFDVDRAVACFKSNETTMVIPDKSDNNTPSTSEGKSKMEVPMTLEELKEKHPDLYKSAMLAGANEEREENSARVKSLTEMKNRDEYKNIPEVVAVIDTAIEDGTTMEATQPLIMAAMMRVMNDPKKLQAVMAANESPEDIDGGGNTKPEMKKKINYEV